MRYISIHKKRKYRLRTWTIHRDIHHTDRTYIIRRNQRSYGQNYRGSHMYRRTILYDRGNHTYRLRNEHGIVRGDLGVAGSSGSIGSWGGEAGAAAGSGAGGGTGMTGGTFRGERVLHSLRDGQAILNIAHLHQRPQNVLGRAGGVCLRSIERCKMSWVTWSWFDDRRRGPNRCIPNVAQLGLVEALSRERDSLAASGVC